MPSPKAVLRDIADLGLDPTKPHVPGKNGRLNAAPKVTGPKFTVKAPEPVPPVQNALKELPKKVEAPPPPVKEPVKAAPPVEEPKVEEPKKDEPVTDEVVADDVSATGGKKGKKAKAAKPEEPPAS